ncbi:MAG: selenocysteine-specific translation elongation factor [Campylobacter sp.]|nr:selenocysteine-specific translation elongation factor [Campylobacter sp.]
MSLIIGTAGHIDHGKTALIKALNGVDGDRLDAEKQRGITIDLSFSNLSENGKNVAFIDVPGHENLVKTMISGAFGFDACMLLIAADDGLMPQSKEHINVLSLLGIKNIILVISKADLAGQERLNKVENEAREFIAKFKNLDILTCFYTSTKDGRGIEDLRKYLFTLKAKTHSQNDIFRYYIDRVFNIKGIGVVVTGSVMGESVCVGEKLFNYDLGKEVTVKNIQNHDKNESIALPSTRTALNLSGVKLEELKKGQLLSKKGYFRAFLSADATLLGENISHNQNLTFCVGAKQVAAKVLILSEQGQSKFVSFKFDKEMFLKFNEPYVVIANGRVAGGGRVLNPISEPLKKASKIQLLNALNKGDFASAFKILIHAHKNGFGLISAYQRFGLSHEQAINIAKTLPNIFVDEMALNVYDENAKERIKGFVKFLLEKNQFAIFSANSINLKLGWASVALVQASINELENAGLITKNEGVYTKVGVDLSLLKQKLEDEIFKILSAQNFAPDAPYNIYDRLEIDRQSGDNALKKLTAQGKVIRLAHNLFISKKSLDEMREILKDIIKKDGFVNVKNAKTHLNLSRKYLIAYLEHLDKDENIVKIDNDRKFKS